MASNFSYIYSSYKRYVVEKTGNTQSMRKIIIPPDKSAIQ